MIEDSSSLLAIGLVLLTCRSLPNDFQTFWEASWKWIFAELVFENASKPIYNSMFIQIFSAIVHSTTLMVSQTNTYQDIQWYICCWKGRKKMQKRLRKKNSFFLYSKLTNSSKVFTLIHKYLDMMRTAEDINISRSLYSSLQINKN